MKCPMCRAKMRAGRIDISRSTSGVIAGLISGDFIPSAQFPYFYPDGGGETVCLDHLRPAFRCPGCEAFLVVGTKQREPRPKPPLPPDPSDAAAITCPACGAAVGEGQSRCPSCDIVVR